VRQSRELQQVGGSAPRAQRAPTHRRARGAQVPSGDMSDSESDEPDEIPQSLFDRIGEMIYTSLGGRPHHAWTHARWVMCGSTA
jgi:hypothetical protein